MHRAGIRLLLGLLLSTWCVATGSAQPVSTEVRVDTTVETRESRDALVGLGWNTGRVEAIRPLRPKTIRIDAKLERVSPGPGEIRLDRLLDDIARVRALGAEPLVILYPLPPWMGADRAEICEPTIFFPEGCSARRVRPDDMEAWEQLIETVVERLATAPEPAFYFESWNEPDIPIFWHDTPEAFLETTRATHRAVGRVIERTGLPVRIGGPASSQPEFAVSYAEAIRSSDLPIHFVSWHWYANNPFLGPDGAEGNIDPVLYEALAGTNPDMTPMVYGEQVRDVRDALGAEKPVLELILDEWNVSAGGLDLRHDSNEGAAFILASLIEMERAGLDRSMLYRSNSSRRSPGDWGILDRQNRRKPAWWAFYAFQKARGALLAIEGDDPEEGFWARATKQGDSVRVLLSTFTVDGDSGREISLQLDGDCAPPYAHRATLDGTSPTLARQSRVPLEAGRLELSLPAQSITQLEIRCQARTSRRCVAGAGGRNDCTRTLQRRLRR